MTTRRVGGLLACTFLLSGGQGVFARPNDRPLPPTGIVIFDNGPIVTHPGGGAGGADVSALQWSLGLTVWGFGPGVPPVADRVAEDFTVPAGATWGIESVTLYAYQIGAAPPTPTINHADVRIWNGPPNEPASMVVFGDATTNRLTSSTWASIYRAGETDLFNTQRPVYVNAVTLGVALPAGTYWIDWRLGGTLANGPWVPPVTILGQAGTGNGKVYSNGSWSPALDPGAGTAQGLPFTLHGANVTAVALAVDAGGNGVMEAAEAAVMAPSWRNDGAFTASNVAGVLSNFIGPAEATYTIDDATATYGDIAAGATAACSADCYGLTATAALRPAQHWDASVDEALTTGARKTWTLHLGESFGDVPTAATFYRFVETLLHHGVTGGCGAGQYCPGSSTTREQMAVFVLVAREGEGYAPAACAAPNLFDDVPETSPFCRFIEELASRGVVAGCSAGLYCPAAAVTRDQMAIFVLRTLDPALAPPACDAPMFDDVPASSPFCRWIEELARRGVVTGCGGGNYCPGAPVTREQMGVFLSATFGLALYGV